MQHWYGTVALIIVVALATHDSVALVRHAWRAPAGPMRETWLGTRALPLWVAVWWSTALALAWW